MTRHPFVLALAVVATVLGASMTAFASTPAALSGRPHGSEADSPPTGGAVADMATPANLASTGTTSSAAVAAGPVTVSVVADTARAVSASIPIGGGTLSVTGRDGTRYALSIPNNALEAGTTVTMTPLLRLDGQPFSGGLIAGVDLQPDGLRLYQAATLVVTPGKGVAVKSPVSVTYEGAGSSFHLYPLSPTKDLRFGLVHFSGYAISGGTSTEVQNQLQRSAGGGEESLEQQLEPDAMSLRTTSPKNANLLLQRLAQHLRDDFNNRIKLLLAAASNDCASSKLAIQQGLGWERRVALLGLDADFATEKAAVDASLLSGLQRCWDEARRTCLDKNDRNQLPTLLGIARSAALTGLDQVDPTRFDPFSVPPCVWRGTITVSAQRNLSSSDATSTSKSTFTMDVGMSGQSNADPVNGAYTVPMTGTNTILTSADYRDHVEDGTDCKVITDITDTSTTSGSTAGTDQVTLRYGTDGTYLLVFDALAGASNGLRTSTYAVTNTCVPADSTYQTNTFPIGYGVAAIALNGQGAYDLRSDTITGSSADNVELPGSAALATLTYTWSLTRGPQQ